jgi:hypothetical protein
VGGSFAGLLVRYSHDLHSGAGAEFGIWELELIAVLNSRMFTKPGILLRIEGGCVLALSILCYREIHTSWILFVALFLVPDLAILGYFGGIRIGTIFYNLVHTLIGPLLLIAYAVLEKSLWLLPYGLVWTSHIGIDHLMLRMNNPRSDAVDGDSVLSLSDQGDLVVPIL